ncbi:hypothetical protein GQ44DRAFT_134316 [Phaeosphaeriaceae sp. PMI808]|nr:hypothetical protein GQ44DRAFT_134316 [Phaeosphaeriaceae sp. PMI808]
MDNLSIKSGDLSASTSQANYNKRQASPDESASNGVVSLSKRSKLGENTSDDNPLSTKEHTPATAAEQDKPADTPDTNGDVQMTGPGDKASDDNPPSAKEPTPATAVEAISEELPTFQAKEAVQFSAQSAAPQSPLVGQVAGHVAKDNPAPISVIQWRNKSTAQRLARCRAAFELRFGGNNETML